jgi:hypothetical protein
MERNRIEIEVKEVSRIIAEIEQDISDKRLEQRDMESARANTRLFGEWNGIVRPV